jgi:hypothetical protein
MASAGILPSSHFFFLRLQLILWRGPRRGIQAANACFQKLKAHFSSDLHGLSCHRHQIPHPYKVVGSSRKRKDPPDGFQPAMPGLT